MSENYIYSSFSIMNDYNYENGYSLPADENDFDLSINEFENEYWGENYNEEGSRTSYSPSNNSDKINSIVHQCDNHAIECNICTGLYCESIGERNRLEISCVCGFWTSLETKKSVQKSEIIVLISEINYENRNRFIKNLKRVKKLLEIDTTQQILCKKMSEPVHLNRFKYGIQGLEL